MPLEERLIDGHILDAYDPPIGVQFLNPIHQKKGIPVRQNSLNLGLFHHGHQWNLLYQDAEKKVALLTRSPTGTPRRAMSSGEHILIVRVSRAKKIIRLHPSLTYSADRTPLPLDPSNPTQVDDRAQSSSPFRSLYL